MQLYLSTVGLITMKNFADACSRMNPGEPMKQLECATRNKVKCRAELYLTRLRERSADTTALRPLIEGTGADPAAKTTAC
jgi:hypothetical protein